MGTMIMELIDPVSLIIISGVVIIALVFMAMVFSVVIAQLMYELFT
jgi:hypothetical protein